MSNLPDACQASENNRHRALLGAAQLSLAINAKGVDELFATAEKWRKISNNLKALVIN
jgi:hypothetical protein